MGYSLPNIGKTMLVIHIEGLLNFKRWYIISIKWDKVV